MPRTTPPPDAYFENIMGHIHRMLAAVAQRQTTTHLDSSLTRTDPTLGTTVQGPPVMHMGQIPNGMPTASPRWISPARPLHGIQMMDTATGAVRSHYGTQPDATHALWTHDNNGNPIHKVGQQADGTTGIWSLTDSGTVVLKEGQVKISGTTYYGIGLYNASGELIAMLGQLPGSDYGLAVYDASGNLQTQIGELPDGTYGIAQLARQGVSSGKLVDVGLLCSPAFKTGNGFSTTSTSYGTAGPSLTATVGASGTALVTVSAQIYVHATNCSGWAGLFIDGTLASDGILIVENNSGGAIGTNGSNFYLATGLSAGSHTFALQGESSLSSVQVDFNAPTVLVQPY